MWQQTLNCRFKNLASAAFRLVVRRHKQDRHIERTELAQNLSTDPTRAYRRAHVPAAVRSRSTPVRSRAYVVTARAAKDLVPSLCVVVRTAGHMSVFYSRLP